MIMKEYTMMFSSSQFQAIKGAHDMDLVQNCSRLIAEAPDGWSLSYTF